MGHQPPRQEEFALRSHQRAIRAIDEGRFARETVAYGDVTVDEGPRRDTTLEKMAGLKPVVEGGTITAACSSQVSDGAAAMLHRLRTGRTANTACTPRARVHHLSVRGEDPIRMLSAPIPATAYALKKTGMSIDDIDLVEINEAFAPVVLAWLKETGADPDKVNVNGGAIALGHPLGATGVEADDDAAARAGAHGRPLRPADHVRGRRTGERDDHRTALSRARQGSRATAPRGGGADHTADLQNVLRLPSCSFGTHELYVRLTGMLPQAHLLFSGFLRMGLNAATWNS